jgi:cell division septation protein DedD
MASRDDRDPVDREILDIIPERFDADPDSRHARRGAQTRVILTIALALLVVAALGVTARHLFFGETPKSQQEGIPVIHADDKPIKTKPTEPGGMDVPNQDKLIYENGAANDGDARSERLLPPPEQPQAPPAQPRQPTIKPAFPAPAPAAKVGGDVPAPAQAPSQPLPPAQEAQPPAKPAAGRQQLAAVTSPSPPPPAAAATAPAQPPKAAATKPAATGGGWLVQLAALKNEADAKNEWNRLRGANKELLGDYSSDIVRVDLGSKGVFWRLRAGPMDEGQARTLCSALAKRSQGCILVKK